MLSLDCALPLPFLAPVSFSRAAFPDPRRSTRNAIRDPSLWSSFPPYLRLALPPLVLLLVRKVTTDETKVPRGPLIGTLPVTGR